MIPLPVEARQLLESGANAHLVTLNADGSPQLSMGTPWCSRLGGIGDEVQVIVQLGGDPCELGQVVIVERLEDPVTHPPHVTWCRVVKQGLTGCG